MKKWKKVKKLKLNALQKAKIALKNALNSQAYSERRAEQANANLDMQAQRARDHDAALRKTIAERDASLLKCHEEIARLKDKIINTFAERDRILVLVDKFLGVEGVLASPAVGVSVPAPKPLANAKGDYIVASPAPAPAQPAYDTNAVARSMEEMARKTWTPTFPKRYGPPRVYGK
jgi:hypothetical protein